MVGRIVDRGEAEALRELGGLVAAQAEDRSQPGARGDRHPGETVQARPAQDVHQHGLELVGRGVAERDPGALAERRHLEQGRTPGVAGPLCEARTRRQIEATDMRLQTPLRRDLGDQLRLLRRRLAQPVIDMGDHQREIQRPTEELQERQERQRVGPAGAGDEEPLTAEPVLAEDPGGVLEEGPAHLSEGLADRGVTRWHGIAAMIPCAP